MAMELSWITKQLAVGGCFPIAAARELAEDHGIAAVIDMRKEARDDEAVLARHGLVLLHLPTLDLRAVAPEMLRDGVEFAARFLERGQRVYVHCQHGIGRSVLLSLCVLVDRGHRPISALRLIKRRRRRASPSPDQYEAWADWLRARGLSPPSFETFAQIAYR
jgi:protein-tyrosine phosphatase